MEKLTVVVADQTDESTCQITQFLRRSDKIKQVHQVFDASQLAPTMSWHQPDVLFLDWEMPEVNAGNVFEHFKDVNHCLQVVMILPFEKLENEERIKAFLYLPKPISRHELSEVLDTVIRRKMRLEHPHRKNGHLAIPVEDGHLFTDPADLFYLEAGKEGTTILTLAGEEYSSKKSLDALQDYMNCTKFVRISESVLMNSALIYKIDRERNHCYVRHRGREFLVPASQEFVRAFHRSRVKV